MPISKQFIIIRKFHSGIIYYVNQFENVKKNGWFLGHALKIAYY
jgi:hypothetical protein